MEVVILSKTPQTISKIVPARQAMNKSTETLNFFIGGFFGGYESIIWLNGKLYHLMDGEPEDEEVRPEEVFECNYPLKKRLGRVLANS